MINTIGRGNRLLDINSSIAANLGGFLIGHTAILNLNLGVRNISNILLRDHKSVLNRWWQIDLQSDYVSLVFHLHLGFQVVIRLKLVGLSG